mgnify:CR=1 FL=1
MIVKALDTVHVSSVSSNNIATGQTFEVDDQAELLRGRRRQAGHGLFRKLAP